MRTVDRLWTTRTLTGYRPEVDELDEPQPFLPPLRLVRMGLHTDARVKEAIGWSAAAWMKHAFADERVTACYRKRGVSDERRAREIRSTAAMVWKLRY